MKRTILIILLIFQICFGFGQTYFNNVYPDDYNYYMNNEIKILDNDNILYIGKSNKNGGFRNIDLKQFDSNGNLIWEDHIGFDSVNLEIAVNNQNSILNDTLLITFGSAQNLNPNVNYKQEPFYFKYDLKNKQVVEYKLINLPLNNSLHNTILHTDNNIYNIGKRFTLTEQDTWETWDMLFTKFDMDGNLILDTTFNFSSLNSWDAFTEIQVYDENHFIVVGWYDEGPNWDCAIGGLDPNYSQFTIYKIDTDGNIIDSKNMDCRTNKVNMIVENKEIYISYLADSTWNDEMIFISKLDSNFNEVWTTYNQFSFDYHLENIRLRKFDDEIIMCGTTLPAAGYYSPNYLGTLVSYDLNGNLNWEKIYYSEGAYYNFITDVNKLSNGDLVFGAMAQVQNGNGWEYNPWLVRTDENGCAYEDTCYYSIEQHFGLEEYVVSDFIYTQQNQIKILQNPTNTSIKLQIENDFLLQNQNLKVEVYNIAGKQLFTQNIAENLFNKNIQNWQNGVYVVTILSEGEIVWSGRLVKN